jgi:type 1 glutamine amidotransferase
MICFAMRMSASSHEEISFNNEELSNGECIVDGESVPDNQMYSVQDQSILTRVLMLCDDYWHPGQIPIDGIASLGEKGFQFDIISNAKDFSPEILTNYSVVLLCKSDNTSQQDRTSWKTEEIEQAFVNYVENGGGLLVVHSGLTGEGSDAFQHLIGCRFIMHPNACPVTVQPIKGHPITEGVEMFCEFDEHYRIEIISQDADIIIASYSPSQGEVSKYESDPTNNTKAWICPAGYVRTQGKGRVCVLTPGHTHEVWQNPNFQRTLVNALQWCAK